MWHLTEGKPCVPHLLPGTERVVNGGLDHSSLLAASFPPLAVSFRWRSMSSSAPAVSGRRHSPASVLTHSSLKCGYTLPFTRWRSLEKIRLEGHHDSIKLDPSLSLLSCPTSICEGEESLVQVTFKWIWSDQSNCTTPFCHPNTNDLGEQMMWLRHSKPQESIQTPYNIITNNTIVYL